MIGRHRHKVDANQAVLVGLLRSLGWSVQILGGVGDGCPDLLVGRDGSTYLIEVKDGAKVPSKRRLTEDEKLWHATWRGDSVRIVETEQQLLEFHEDHCRAV